MIKNVLFLSVLLCINSIVFSSEFNKDFSKLHASSYNTQQENKLACETREDGKISKKKLSPSQEDEVRKTLGGVYTIEEINNFMELYITGSGMSVSERTALIPVRVLETINDKIDQTLLPEIDNNEEAAEEAVNNGISHTLLPAVENNEESDDINNEMDHTLLPEVENNEEAAAK